MSLAYRMDNRTPEQFKKDIFECTMIERKIVDAYANHIFNKFGIELTIKDNGTDNTGKVQKRVTTKADFLVNGVPLEVKFNREMQQVFRIKTYQVNSYLKQDVRILWVNGLTTKQPLFTIMKKHDLQFLVDGCEPKPFFPWGNKLVYELNADDYVWFPISIDFDEEIEEVS
ncbi:hypothetical protein H1164_08335 [Thermoactinomyces daqus]|uniref:Uncharacterized protein n=1 Tax=Thermoactinomyces daqus TaxID=1329516 RepID=A0A7W2AII2_9BACL|nr:hypothetical protein [Thermoactinomyces daqus]MBA4542908.1 hypothetical protein [Thermoactinomyces daqus]